MREFDKFFVIKEVGRRYREIFPNDKIEITILSFGIGEDKTKPSTNMFFCLDPNRELIGFAIHYISKKILRFYNHEGEDVGLETNMKFKPLKKGKVAGRFKT